MTVKTQRSAGGVDAERSSKTSHERRSLWQTLFANDSPVALLTILFVLSLLLFLALVGYAWRSPEDLKPPPILEAYKISLQFLLVTTVGAALVGTLNYLRDRQSRMDQQKKDLEAKRDEKISAIRDFHARASVLYKSTKNIKRRFRSSSSWRGHDDDSDIVLPREDFVALMSQLLQTQIDFEILRDNIASRDDLFDGQVEKDIESELNYVARYLHDVYREYEEGCISIECDEARVETHCKRLRDFISQRDTPHQIAQLSREIREAANEGTLSVDEMSKFLKKIENQLRTLKGERYASVASAFAHLAMENIQNEVQRLLGTMHIEGGDKRNDSRGQL